MLRSLLLAATVFAIAGAGFGAAFIFGLGYVWTTLFRVQEISYSILGDIPFQFSFAAATIFFYLLMDRRHPPHLTGGTVLLCLFAGWITATTTWAEVPAAAWPKWDWAFKTICFGIALPYLFRSRVQIESVLLVVVIAISASVVPVAIKTAISGGGYGMALGLSSENSGLYESSTLAVVSVMMIPLILFLGRHGQIFPGSAVIQAGFGVLAVIFGIAALGTYARAGLVSLVVLSLIMWFRSRRKILYVMAAAAVLVLSVPFLSEAWSERMSTIGTYDADSSAMGRIAVWRWTIGYVLQHPLGGGFNAFLINSYSIVLASGEVMEASAKAFHSIYFEILGEHGFVGIGIFSFIVLNFFANMHYVTRRSAGIQGLAWASDLARSLASAMAIFLCGGSFIGVAFQPFFYIMIGVGISLQQYVRRALANQAPRKSGVLVSSGKAGSVIAN